MKARTETVKARYVVGCDGARSIVRTSIGRELHGDPANHAWGVMDAAGGHRLLQTSAAISVGIQSAHEGQECA